MNISQINKTIYQDKINSERLTKTNKNRFDLINKITIETINKLNENNLNIVDIGCRDCSYFDNISNINTNKLIGIDNVKKFIELGKKKGYDIIEHDLEKPLPLKNKSIDIINCQQVIEHLLDTQEFIREIHRKLKMNGYLLIGIPNFNSFASRIRFLFGYRPLQYSPVLQWSFGNHKSMFNLNDIKKLLIDNNFKIEKIYGLDLFLSLKKYNKGINLNWLAKLFPSLAQKIMIIAKKV